MMTQERFIEIIEAYGADPARWPEAERADALAHAEAHPEQADPVLAEAAALDALLELVEVQPSDLLQRRILKAFPAPPARTVRPQWQIPVAAAAALLVGAFIGFASGAMTVTATPVEDTVYADAFNGLDQDWVDWLGGEV